MRGKEERVQVWTAYDGAGELVGLFPFFVTAAYRRIPVKALEVWKHRHCFVCTPLVAREHSGAVCDALADWAGSGAGGARTLVLRYQKVLGRLTELFTKRAAERGIPWAIFDRHERAAFESRHPEGADRYAEEQLSQKRLRALRNAVAKFEPEGGSHAEYFQVTPDEVAEISEEFLELEKSGWKGDEGTALGATAADAAFFRETIERGVATGAVYYGRLHLGDSLAAALVDFHAGGQAFAFKIAYNHALRSYTPGLVLELQRVKWLHSPEWRDCSVDSCAAPDNQTFNRLWKNRCNLGSVSCARRGLLGRLVIGLPQLLGSG